MGFDEKEEGLEKGKDRGFQMRHREIERPKPHIAHYHIICTVVVYYPIM
jgi:hypothetical protein